MSTRTKTYGFAAAVAAITIALPTAVQAYAEPETPSPSTTAPASPASPSETTPSATTPSTPSTTAIPVPTSTKVPDPQGSGCDAYRSKHPAGSPASIEAMALQKGSQALASNPDLSIFSDAISGKLNPDINIANVLDNGPYVVFAPTNEAFAKLDPATLNTLKTDPVVLLPTLFYHMVLGYLGPNDVQGKMPTQDGRSVTVTGKNADIKVNDAKLVCAYTARGAYIYMIDTVLTPPVPAAENGATTTATTTATTSATPTTGAAEATSTTTATPTTSAAPSTSAASSAAETASSAASSAAETASSAASSAASATTTTAKPAA